MNDYSTSYNYSFESSSPSTFTYFYAPLLPPTCPLHSPHIFYTSPSMNLSPLSYTYYQQQEPQVYSPPLVQQRMY